MDGTGDVMPINVVDDKLRAKVRDHWHSRSLEQIATLCGCSPKTVSKVAVDLGLPSKQYHRNDPPRRIATKAWAPPPPVARPSWFDDAATFGARLVAGR